MRLFRSAIFINNLTEKTKHKKRTTSTEKHRPSISSSIVTKMTPKNITQKKRRKRRRINRNATAAQSQRIILELGHQHIRLYCTLALEFLEFFLFASFSFLLLFVRFSANLARDIFLCHFMSPHTIKKTHTPLPPRHLPPRWLVNTTTDTMRYASYRIAKLNKS